MIIDWHWEGMTMKMRRGDGLHALTPAGGLAGGLAATPGGMECLQPPSMQKMVTHLWSTAPPFVCNVISVRSMLAREGPIGRLGTEAGQPTQQAAWGGWSTARKAAP